MNLYITRISETSAGVKAGSKAAYELLAYAFLTEYDEDLPEIKKTPNGKPYFPERPDIYFSLSHTKTHVLCVLSGFPVGADVESPRVISPRAVKFFCSAVEEALFDPLDLWVLKESYVKLIGGRLPSIKLLRFSRCNGQIIAPDATVASKLYRIDGCTAAVCSHGDSPPESIELITSSYD